MYKYILIDWDGCLIDNLAIWLAAYKKRFSEYGVSPSDGEIVKKAFGDWNGPSKFGIPDSQKFLSELIKDVNISMKSAELHLNVAETLSKVKGAGRLLVMITTSKREMVLPIAKARGIAGLFDLILTAEDVQRHKPNPEIIFKAIDHFNADKSQVLVVGDGPKDVEAGKRAGVDTAVYYPKANKLFYDEKSLRKLNSRYIITDFRKLIDI